jgi:hypothetical protein
VPEQTPLEGGFERGIFNRLRASFPFMSVSTKPKKDLNCSALQ